MKRVVLAMSLLSAIWAGAPLSAQAMDVEQYVEIAGKSLKTVKRGKTKDVDKIIVQQRELIRLGVEGCLEFAEKSPADAKMMHLVVLNSLKMRNLSLDQMEKEWLQGGYLRAHGIDIDKFSARDKQASYYDAVVRPAVAIIALEKYKKSKDPELLGTVQEQLSEALDVVESLQ